MFFYFFPHFSTETDTNAITPLQNIVFCKKRQVSYNIKKAYRQIIRFNRYTPLFLRIFVHMSMYCHIELIQRITFYFSSVVCGTNFVPSALYAPSQISIFTKEQPVYVFVVIHTHGYEPFTFSASSSTYLPGHHCPAF